MVIKQIKRSKFQNISNFSIASVALLAITFGSLGVGLNRIYAQPEAREEAKARQFANDLSKDFNKLSEENLKKLKAEIEKIRKYNAQLESKSKELYLKLEQQKEQSRDKKSLGIALKNANAELSVLKQQKQDLLNKIKEIFKKARTREAYLYEKQAEECMKAKFFELAITDYENSLRLNSDQAQVHYTLSLLYKQINQDRKQAIAHMKEYLELSPQAKNRDEAQYIIDMLSEDMIKKEVF